MFCLCKIWAYVCQICANPTKTRKINANKIIKKNDENFIQKCLGVEQLIEVTKSFKSSVF